MNRATILLVQASLLGACGGGAPAAAHPAAEGVPVDTSVPLAVSRIEGDGVVVHTLVAPDSSAAVTSHVVETEGHLVVFDTQLFRGYARQLREYVDGLGKPIDRVVITHGHPDHYLGLEHFADVPSWAFEETRVDIRQRQRFHIRMHRETERECDAVAERAVIPTNVLEEGDYELDGITLRFSRARDAEDNDQLIVYVPAARALILQDLVANEVHPYSATGMIPHWIEVLRAAQETYPDIEHVLAGHGPPGGPEVIPEMIGYLEGAARIHEADLEPEAFRDAFLSGWPDRRGTYVVEMMVTMLRSRR
ncbi:MAG: hypothetical protein SangKO_013290 [Sandaracinaceae bacterium]